MSVLDLLCVCEQNAEVSDIKSTQQAQSASLEQHMRKAEERDAELKRTLENGAKNERALVVAQKVCF
jgi:hypothetical protein